MMVSVGFLSELVTNEAPSATNKFFTSCAWQYWFSTEVFGSLPHPCRPNLVNNHPPSAMPYGLSVPVETPK